MARLKQIAVDEATGKTKELYQAIQKQIGTVPNIFLSLGNSPAALEAYLSIGKTLRTGTLTPSENEAIALAVSQYNNCRYCLSAHTLLGKMAGLQEGEMLQIRQNRGEQKAAKLAQFARVVMEKKGFVSDSELAAVRDAGYSDEQLSEALMVVAQTIFTNFFNHVNDTELDFPAAPELQAGATRR